MAWIFRRAGIARTVVVCAALLPLGGLAADDGAAAGNGPEPAAEAGRPVLDEIIVTSRKVQETLGDIPLSVSVIDGDKIADAGLDKIEDLVAYTPNITLSETGIGTNLYVRGIGSGINQGFEQSVGLYIDGIYYGRAQLTRMPFLDLSRVEALRGPQVTLLGNNSIAGALNLTTAKPTDSFESRVTALYEPDHGETELTGVISGPVAGNLSARVALRAYGIDGYLKNTVAGRDEPDRTEQSGRLTLLWQGDRFTGTAKVERNTFDVRGRQIEIFNELPATTRGSSPTGFSRNTGSSGLWQAGQTYLQYVNQFLAANPDPAILDASLDFRRGGNGGVLQDGTSIRGDYSDNTVDSAVLDLEWDLGGYNLSATTGFLRYEYAENCDCDFTGAYIFNLLSNESYRQWSQELRLTSPEDSPLRGMVGLYYQTEGLTFRDGFQVPAGEGVTRLVGYATVGDPAAADGTIGNTSVFRDFVQDTDLYSAFGSLWFDVTDRWRNTLGLRYARTEKVATRQLQIGDLQQRSIAATAGIDDPRITNGVVAFSSIFRAAPHTLAGERIRDRLSWEFTTQYDFTPDVMGYASAKRGYKSGGFDARSNSEPIPGSTGGGVLYPADLSTVVANNVQPGSFEFADERALAFEVGTKLTLLDGAAELDINYFLTRYDDLQISIFDGTVGFNVGNAARATTQGIEVGGRWQISDAWFLNGSIGWLDFNFDSFPNGQCVQGQAPDDPVTGSCDFSGRTNQYVADFSSALTLNYRRAVGPLVFKSALDVNYTDDYLPSQNLDTRVRQDAYAQVNLRLALAAEDDRWEIALLGRNLTDETIITFANDTPLAFSQFGSPSYYAFIARPRSIAIQASYRFGD